MHRFLIFCCLICTCSSTIADPQSSSLTAIVAPSGYFQPQTASRLYDEKVVTALEHLQSQHVYLKHLENMRRALEQELSIVRLMGECQLAGGICTGRGIEEQAVIPEREAPPPQELAPLQASPFPEEVSQPLPLPPPVHELPSWVGVYRDVALLMSEGRYLEVRVGEKVGVFTVTAIELDQVELLGPNGTVVLQSQQSSQRSTPQPTETISPQVRAGQFQLPPTDYGNRF